MLKGRGIMSILTSPKFYHSAYAAGLLPTIVSIQMSVDTYFDSQNPTTNYDINTSLNVGHRTAPSNIGRAWIKPDFSSIPASKTFLAASLFLTPVSDSSNNARTMSAHRCLRDVVSTQATWNIWKTANNWGTAGCSNSTTDYDGAVALGTMTQPASPTINTALEMTLTASELQKLYDGTYTNNGIVLFVATQNDDQIAYASKEDATSAYRPFITITYS